jgi:hypothetical protein
MINRGFTSKILHISAYTIRHITSPLQSFCLERLHKTEMDDKIQSNENVSYWITESFLTILNVSQVTMLTGITFCGINGNINSYKCQWGLNLRHALWQWIEPLSL